MSVVHKILYWLLGLNLWEPTRLQTINWFCASVISLVCASVRSWFWFGTAITRGQRISASIDIGGAAKRTFEVVAADIVYSPRYTSGWTFQPGVLNFMLSITRFATFMFNWQVRFRNRYLTVFHTWVMFMRKLSIFRRFTSKRCAGVTVRNFWAIILSMVGPTLWARWMSRSME